MRNIYKKPCPLSTFNPFSDRPCFFFLGGGGTKEPKPLPGARKLAKDDLSTHIIRHIPPINLCLAIIRPPPNLLTNLPSRHNIIHPLPRFQMSKDGTSDIPIDVLGRLTAGGEQGPDKGCHGTGEDDDA